jgi:hypothetical protein
MKWKPTTLLLGTKAEKPQQIIVKCCANMIIESSLGNNNQITIYPNPAKAHIAIDFGTISNTSGGSYKIKKSQNQLRFWHFL